MKSYRSLTALACLSLAFSGGLQTSHAQQSDAAPSPVEEQAAPESLTHLSIGDPIPKNLLEGVTWIQGDEVKSFDEKGKVYLIENWATWCGPCIAVIPHVNELHTKYAQRGLVIIGMNVWEDGLEHVKKFVKKQGDGMSYRVAYSGGRDSAFADKLLTPLGVTGIPQAVIVQDGKIVASMHPARIKPELIEAFLSGEFEPAAQQKTQNEASAKHAALMNQIRPLIEKEDWGAAKPLVQLLDDDQRVKPMLLLKIAIAQADWPELLKLRSDAKAERYGTDFSPVVVDASVVHDASISAGAEGYAKVALEDFAEAPASHIPEAEIKLMSHFRKARFAFMLGAKDDSLDALTRASGFVDQLDNPEAQAYFGALVKAAADKVKTGSFPEASRLNSP